MNLLDGAFPIGRLFGITIRVHMLWVLWVAFRLMDGRGDIGQELFFILLLFGIVLIHEFGHCLGARTVGGDAHNILMWPLGGLALADAPMRPWPQFVTVACGPLVNVVFCLVSGAILVAYMGTFKVVWLNPFGGIYTTGTWSWLEFVFVFYQVNWLLLCFNMLPVFPMDGGQLLRAILWPLLGLQQATLLAAGLGLIGSAGFVVWWLNGGGGPMLVLIAIMGALSSWQHLQAARYGVLREDSRYEGYYGPTHDPRPWWRRIFKMGPTRRRRPLEYDRGPAPANPNPGGWTRVLSEREQEEAELDRILKKVSEHGTQSLSYIERQTLERITRKRQAEEREFQRGNRL